MIEYVPFEERHIDGLVKVEEECFNSGYARNTFEKELQNRLAFYIVAEENGEVLGYAGLWNMCGCADIMNVGVHPIHRRKGIAETMLEKLEIYCNENAIFEINLEVRVGNIPARTLYRKAGYEEIAVSAGQRGVQVLLSPNDLRDYVGAVVTELT